MIEWLKAFAANYPTLAPFLIGLTLTVAGLSIPISADLVILLAATLAAKVIPGSYLNFYLSILIGSLFAAYAAYWQGRLFGNYLLNFSFFKKLFPEERILKIKDHYTKHGWMTLIIGRFIPFGFRNVLFFSTGLSKFSFKKFIFRDLVACLLWTTSIFSLFYHLLHKMDDLVPFIKKFNLVIFSLVGLILFSLVWYKRAKKQRTNG
jgi:membrane protein DedA with SNARE-associated domain